MYISIRYVVEVGIYYPFALATLNCEKKPSSKLLARFSDVLCIRGMENKYPLSLETDFCKSNNYTLLGIIIIWLNYYLKIFCNGMTQTYF